MSITTWKSWHNLNWNLKRKKIPKILQKFFLGVVVIFTLTSLCYCEWKCQLHVLNLTFTYVVKHYLHKYVCTYNVGKLYKSILTIFAHKCCKGERGREDFFLQVLLDRLGCDSCSKWPKSWRLILVGLEVSWEIDTFLKKML